MVAKKVMLVSYLLFLVFFGEILCAEDIPDPALKGGVKTGGNGLEFVDLVNEKAGFSISVPLTWETSEKLMGAMTVAVSPMEESDTFRENINVVLEELTSTISVEEYVVASDRMLLKIFKEFEQHERGPIAAGYLSGILSGYSYEMDGQRLRLMQAVFVFGKRAYVVSCTVQYDRFSEYEPIFRKIIKSFKLAE